VTSRFAPVHDIDGPKVRLGFLWFVVSTGAAFVSRELLAVVMALAAALAADQLVRLHLPSLCAPATGSGWQRAQRGLGNPVRVVAVLAAAAMPLAATGGGARLTGALAFATMAGFVGLLGISDDRPVVAQAMPFLAAVSMGLAAASPVLLHRLGSGAALALLALIAAYDAGDFLVGTGAGTTWEGPAAGVAAVAVVGFSIYVLALPPLEEEGAMAAALLVGMLAPLGPPIASALVGDGRTPARFVRRLDSLLLAGPVVAFALAALLPKLVRGG
jgi:hypothetical protein